MKKKYKKYKNGVERFLTSDKGKRMFNFLYSWGASIVIIGALFKILHLPYGNQMLFIGMMFEAFIFFISGFDKPIKDYNWEEVFPVLGTKAEEDRPQFGGGGGGSVVMGGGGFTGGGTKLTPEEIEALKAQGGGGGFVGSGGFTGGGYAGSPVVIGGAGGGTNLTPEEIEALKAQGGGGGFVGGGGFTGGGYAGGPVVIGGAGGGTNLTPEEIEALKAQGGGGFVGGGGFTGGGYAGGPIIIGGGGGTKLTPEEIEALKAQGGGEGGFVGGGGFIGGGVVGGGGGLPSFELPPELNVSEEDSRNLSESIKKLASAAEQLSKMGELTEATQQCMSQLTEMGDRMQRFGEVTNSLTDASSVLLDSYQLVVENSENIQSNSSGYIHQMESLNRNISGLNTIYEIQLKSISSQIDTIERINGGLIRIRELYDGSITDSSVFKSETEKMAQQLAALNNIYSRLLQAMTMNANPMYGVYPNMPHNPNDK